MSIAFGFVLVLLWPFDLLPYSLGSCFGIDFGLLFRFGFSFSFQFLVLVYVWFMFCSCSVCFWFWFMFGFGFGFELRLLRFGFVFTSAFVSFLTSIFYYGFNWFRFRFRAGSFTVPLFGFSVPF